MPFEVGGWARMSHSIDSHDGAVTTYTILQNTSRDCMYCGAEAALCVRTYVCTYVRTADVIYRAHTRIDDVCRTIGSHLSKAASPL